MDTLSHAAWGYAAVPGRERFGWWSALAGAAPDLLWFVPATAERVAEGGWSAVTIGRDRNIWRADGPPLPPELVDAYHRYYVNTHSLLLLALVTALVLTTPWRRWAWLAVPYALHILMDIPTHERYQTQPLFPLSTWHVNGLTWTDPRIFWPNVVALVLVYAWILRARARARNMAS